MSTERLSAAELREYFRSLTEDELVGIAVYGAMQRDRFAAQNELDLREADAQSGRGTDTGLDVE